MLVVVCVFSSFCWLRPLKDKNTTTLARKLWKIFCLFGFPRVFQTDGDATMCTDIIKAMMDTHGSTHAAISAYNPRCLGKAESKCKWAALTCRKNAAVSGRTVWHEMPFTNVALNDKWDAVTNSTPRMVMMGRHSNELSDYTLTEDGPISDEERKSWTAHQEYLSSLMLPAWSDKIEAARVKQAATVNDSKRIAEALPEGTPVMFTVPGLQSKNAQPFIGLYKTKQASQDHHYDIFTLAGELFKASVPIDQLKPWTTATPAERAELDRNHYALDKIVASRTQSGAVFYKCRWIGFGEDEDTWKPVANVPGPAIRKFVASVDAARVLRRSNRGAQR